MNGIVNEKEAAKYIGMSVSFLRQARCEGSTANKTRGPSWYKLGTAVRYRISDLDQWLEAHRQKVVSSNGS